MIPRPSDLPPSYPVRVQCRLERRQITAISRAAIRAMLAVGTPSTTPVVVHLCRGCRQYHVVTLGEIDWGRQSPEGQPPRAA